jgi:hypothetical protein
MYCNPGKVEILSINPLFIIIIIIITNVYITDLIGNLEKN